MPQTLALQARLPEIDASEPVLRRQKLEANDLSLDRAVLDNQVHAAKAGEDIGKLGALAAYREATRRGDTAGAAAAVKGYPDVMAPLADAYRKLADDPKARAEMEKRGQMIARAAVEVSAVPEGADRVALWNAKLDELKKAKVITGDQHKEFYGNPSQLILDRAINMGRSLEKIIEEHKKGAGGGYETLSAADKLHVDEQARKEATSGVSDFDSVPAEEMAKRIAAARQRIIDRNFPSKKPPAAGAAKVETGTLKSFVNSGASLAPVTEGAVTGKAAAKETPKFDAQNPAAPRTTEEFNALPVGTPVMNKDGTVRFKTKNIE